MTSHRPGMRADTTITPRHALTMWHAIKLLGSAGELYPIERRLGRPLSSKTSCLDLRSQAMSLSGTVFLLLNLL